MSDVRVRFPPSPTGYCHVGTARMAVLNYLFARNHGGQIVFRSEDTDRERSKKEYEDDIIESIRWLGLDWDEFYRQTERIAVYREALTRLIQEDKAYLSDEPSKNNPEQNVQVVRLRNPGTTVTFTDIIRGNITFDTTELGDFVIARAIDDPLYHLSVVVDDAEHRITHVIRGEEHISNTPRQILIQEALGLPRPQYAHYPLFLGADRSKLSKRKGDVSVRDYRAQGYLPEALLNFIGTLGWTPPSGKEILSLQDMVKEFDLADLHKSGAVFDMEKLRWYNRTYLRDMESETFIQYYMPALERGISQRGLPWNATIAQKLEPLLRTTLDCSGDLEVAVVAGEFDFFFADPALAETKLPEKKSNVEEAITHLKHARDTLATLDEFSSTSVKDALWGYATEKGRGAVLWPLRYSLSGKEKSPDPFVIADIIGKEATLRRIDAALKLLQRV
jgi:glutamyl-tRNA synthetase